MGAVYPLGTFVEAALVLPTYCSAFPHLLDWYQRIEPDTQGEAFINMLHHRSLIIGPEDEIADKLRSALKLVRPTLPLVRLRDYPALDELAKLLRVQKPTIVLISV